MADLRYLPAQHRLEFGATSHDRITAFDDGNSGRTHESSNSSQSHRRTINSDPPPNVSAAFSDDRLTSCDAHLNLLDRIVDKKAMTFEKWADDHRIGRSTFFDWKALRGACKPLKGKVSRKKSLEIEAAIEKDAEKLGLATRTDSD
jgi:hypothetical protein